MSFLLSPISGQPHAFRRVDTGTITNTLRLLYLTRSGDTLSAGGEEIAVAVGQLTGPGHPSIVQKGMRSNSLFLRFRGGCGSILLLLLWVVVCVVPSSPCRGQPPPATAGVENDGETYQDDTIDFSNFGRFLKDAVFGRAAGDGDTSDDPFSGLKTSSGASPGDVFLQQFAKLFQTITGSSDGKEEEGLSAEDNEFLTNLIGSVASSQQQNRETLEQLIGIFWNAAKRVHQQLESTFKGTIDQFSVNPLQAFYYMQQQEVENNAVHKRKQHAFLPPLPLPQALPLADGLYLSQLAYVDTCEHVTEHLRQFHNDRWALLNCSVTGRPARPAHFVAVRKVAPPLAQQPKNAWERILNNLDSRQGRRDGDVLEVAIVVRGSKEIADFISDGLLAPADYRGGKAHDGILESAKWLHESYHHFLLNLLTMTGLGKVKLWLVGHSLGAGTASLAAFEFNEHSVNGTIDANALGFGTPAVVSKELSERMKETVTTVINDADCIPRMSGAAIVNAWVQAASYDGWIDHAHDDIRILMKVMKENLPFPELSEKILEGMLEWLSEIKEKQQKVDSDSEKLHVEPVLYPPGDCIHLFRTGTKWQGVYMPCTRFDAIEAVGHLVWDHLIPTGYYEGLLGYLRGLKRDLNWRFEPDLMDLPVPT